MPNRTRKVSFKSKVVSEMEILEKSDRIITRYFQEARHLEEIVGIKEDSEERDIWRKYSKDRMKTVSVALVFCLHIGVDPPDPIPKPAECAKKEGWIDPFSCHPQRALQKIATSVQKSYERWQPRARYKVATDPTTEDVRKLCLSMRRNAKEERVLFHYNGHGVPRPTSNGEIWVFNRTFTQYIPLSIYDLQTWMEFPSIYVWDCSSAETIVNSFDRFADDHEREWGRDLEAHQEQSTHPLPVITSHMTDEQQADALKFRKKPRYRDCIQLAACRVDERLPTNKDLPADLFTSCLTTPIQTSILWYVVKSGRRSHFSENFLDEIPGSLGDRKTVLGELNWIFTAITDTIAWNSLPMEDFQRLFRQDLLLASLFRSFILAEKIMGENGCGVVSSPALPSTSDHPLWDSWEYTLDLTLNHLKAVPKNNSFTITRDLVFSRSKIMELNTLVDLSGIIGDAQEMQHNWFFVEQLRAFEVWLEYGSEKRKPPQQLPIVLQVLLSQAHRLRALELLARFLDLGQWAVAHALSVGVFPYVQKLLQSNTRELRQWLAFIWAKILAVDPSCQTELFRENGDDTPRYDNHHRAKAPLRYFYFVHILNDPETSPRQKIVPAFILATLFHNNFRLAQESLTEQRYVNLCTELLNDPATKVCRLLKLWVLIGLGRLWADYDEARWQAVRLNAYMKVVGELEDGAPEVRAAAVYALGCLVKNRSENNEHAAFVDQQLCDELCSKCTLDGSVLVRVELVVAIQWFIIDFEQRFAKMLIGIAEKVKIELRKDDDSPDCDVVDVAATIPHVVDPDRTSRLDGGRRRKQNSESTMPEEIVCGQKGLSATPSRLLNHNAHAYSEHEALRDRARRQIRHLESKQFHEPMERTWLAVLRLALDPAIKVATMSQVLVRRIEQVAIEKLEAVDQKISSFSTAHLHQAVQPTSSTNLAETPKEKKEASQNMEVSRSAEDEHRGGAGGVLFVVGSPAGNGSLAANGANGALRGGHTTPLAPPAPPTRKFSMPATKTPRSEGRISKDVAIKLAKPALAFTPKRSTTGRGDWSKNKKEPSLHEPMVKSEFVEWCSRIFIEPILDLVQCNDQDDNMTDRVLTEVNPTDWAYHTKEGMVQAAAEEFRRKTSADRIEMQLAIHEASRIRAMTMSSLRKILYYTDGRNVNLLRYETKTYVARMFPANGGNAFNTDLTTSLIVINDLSREMLLCGSDNGIIRIWDPNYNIHSHEFECEEKTVTSSSGQVPKSKEPKMVTSSLPLYDQTKTPMDREEKMTCLYDWCQSTGRVVCGGNVRVVRIWDAHCEKTVQDVSIGTRCGAATALSADLDDSNLVAVGFRNGSLHVHDLRIPSRASQIMRFEEGRQRVVGCAIRSAAQSNKLFMVTENGMLSVFEPRMFQEPTFEQQINGIDYVSALDVHNNGELLGCATQTGAFNEVKLFDMKGKGGNSMGNINMMTANNNFAIGRIQAVTMHKMRCLVAVADEKYVGIFAKRGMQL